MNKQIKISIFGYELSIQLRKTGAQSRAFDPIQIDERAKKEALDSLDLTALQAKARAARLAFNSEN